MHYKEWLGGQDVVMRLSYSAGERMFVDFSGDTMRDRRPDDRREEKAEVFVAVLGCSGLLYVEATQGSGPALVAICPRARLLLLRRRRRDHRPR